MTPINSKYALEYFERDLLQSTLFFKNKYGVELDNYNVILEDARKIIQDKVDGKNTNDEDENIADAEKLSNSYKEQYDIEESNFNENKKLDEKEYSILDK